MRTFEVFLGEFYSLKGCLFAIFLGSKGGGAFAEDLLGEKMVPKRKETRKHIHLKNFCEKRTFARCLRHLVFLALKGFTTKPH